ncbi:TolC family protein [Acidithiobacillus sp. AMEEHan]|uniref:TolC family protein n=1 Tax=Acidithiobacillus sp. AMEEHan TaxID=2994951 RepID=UPI0027E52CBB|nr:TolC family protein [Acidithiobacillus sp. AMEEHan]
MISFPEKSLPFRSRHALAWIMLGSVAGLLTPGQATATRLDLSAAERLLQQQNPSLAAYQQKIQALRHQAVAAAQLPDPHISLGAVNLPTNNFSMNQQQMSMLSVGLSQTFPPFGQLALRGRQLRMEATAETAIRAERAAELRWLLQQSWIQAQVAHQERSILQRQKRLDQMTEQAAVDAYRAGRVDQAAVLRSQLALANLENRMDQVRAQQQTALARIAELLGSTSALQLRWSWPHLQPPAPLAALQMKLPGQPALQAAAASSRAAALAVRVARTNLLPSITVSTAYGQDFMPGSPNWLSIGVNLSLPIFPGDRQDQTIAAAQEKEMAAEDTYEEERLRLARQIHTAYAQFQAADAQYQRSEKTLLPLATQTYRAELAGFIAGRTSMQSVLHAQNSVLETALQALVARENQALSSAELAYLATQYQGAQS